MLQWIWVGIYIFELTFSFSSEKYPEVELWDRMTVLFLVFWEIPMLFSIVAAAIIRKSLFPTSSLTLLIFCLFDDSHSDMCEVLFHWSFDLHFPYDYWYWVSFHVLAGHLYMFSGKMSLQNFCPFFKRVVLLVVVFWGWIA